MARKRAFTLVELLVVIGIIAVLISVLLPTLNRARASAQTVQCLSNVRQLGMAAMLFAHEHRGYLPTASDDRWAKLNDSSRMKFAYRHEPTHADGQVVKDWASSLVRALGGKDDQTFQTAARAQSRVFQCPSDVWLDDSNPGYRLFNNVAPSSGYFPISYGINADITCLVDQGGVGKFSQSDIVSVHGGPKVGSGLWGQPLQCKLSKIQRPAEVLLFADCGTRPQFGSIVAPLDYNDSLYYTTNFAGGGTLRAMASTSWLRDRIPLKRHGNKINIAFADGHGETVLFAFFDQVRITPYR